MIDIKLRPYQVEVGRAVVDSVLHRHGLTFTVEVARQGGKNELSAQLEVLLLTLFMGRGGNLVKAAPTFRPQTLISLQRLQERLDQAGYGLFWAREQGYMVRLGKARAVFLSADKDSHVMGTTAHLLLEVDESQDVAPGEVQPGLQAHGGLHQCHHRPLRHHLGRFQPPGDNQAAEPGAGEKDL